MTFFKHPSISSRSNNSNNNNNNNNNGDNNIIIIIYEFLKQVALVPQHFIPLISGLY